MESGTSELTAVMNRLEQLETQNRRFKQIGALALILLGSVFLMGQASPNRTVEANEFVLKDTNGNIRGKLSMTILGPEFALFTEKGERRASLAVLADTPILALYDATGAQTSLNFLTGSPDFSLSDARGKIRASLDVRPDGPNLSLFGANGNVQAILGSSADMPGIALFDADGKPRAGLAALANGTTLELSDGEGFKTTIGTTDLVTSRTGETQKTSAASVVLFDRDKKVLWRAP